MWNKVFQAIASAEFIAFISLLISIYTFYDTHKYKKPKVIFMVHGYDKNNNGNMGIYIYNRMNLPLTIVILYLEERIGNCYETYVPQILGDNNNDMEGHRDSIVKLPKTIIIQPYSCESFILKYDRPVGNNRKAKLFEISEFYLKIQTGDNRKFKIKLRHKINKSQ